MRYNEEGVTRTSEELINESEDQGVRKLGKRSVIEMPRIYKQQHMNNSSMNKNISKSNIINSKSN